MFGRTFAQEAKTVVRDYRWMFEFILSYRFQHRLPLAQLESKSALFYYLIRVRYILIFLLLAVFFSFKSAF